MIDIDPSEFDLYDDVDRAAEYKEEYEREWRIIEETEKDYEDTHEDCEKPEGERGEEEMSEADSIPKKKQKIDNEEEEDFKLNIFRLKNKKYFIHNHKITSTNGNESSGSLTIQILGIKNQNGLNDFFISKEDFFFITKFHSGTVLQNRLKWIRLERNLDRQFKIFSPLSKDDELILKSKFRFRGASIYIPIKEIFKNVKIPEINSLYNFLLLVPQE